VNLSTRKVVTTGRKSSIGKRPEKGHKGEGAQENINFRRFHFPTPELFTHAGKQCPQTGSPYAALLPQSKEANRILGKKKCAKKFGKKTFRDGGGLKGEVGAGNNDLLQSECRRRAPGLITGDLTEKGEGKGI